MRKTKSALLHSAIALLLCISMLIGSTFAWFTDSVTSGTNIIQSGNLDIEMYWTDDLDSGNWYNVAEDAHNTIFSYDNWEPGYTDVKYIKLVNTGSLAMNYKLTLTPQGAVGKLAEVINVYFSNSEVELLERSDLSKLRAIGLLNNVLNGGATAEGTLLPAGEVGLHPAGEVVMTIAMSMITTAGNDYQNESSGEFTVTALATQAAFEKDSFGSDYDDDAEYPAELVADKATAAVTPVDGKVPAGGVTLTGANITAFVPAGAAMAPGADKLTLAVTPMEHTTSDIKVVNDEVLIPMDVHIEGLAEDNTVPAIISLGEVLPKYLNMGNYHLFHVEDGVNNEMTLVDSEAQLTQHNQYTYDPMTGEVTVAMATFSEVALVADTSAKWEGGYDYSWYEDKSSPYTIANADQLYAFAKIVGGMAENRERYDFAGAYVKLLCDINLNSGRATPEGEEKTRIFYPIGYYNNKGADTRDDAQGVTGVDTTVYSFSGTFDGNGHTISNFYQNTWEMYGDYNNGYSGTPNYYKDAMGLFGYVNGGKVMNLTVDSFDSDGEFTPTGVIAAYAVNSTFENIAITNCNPRVYNTGNGGIVGIGGNSDDPDTYNLTFRNITIDNTNKISALWGSYDVACGGLVGMFRGAGYVYMTNCHVAAQMDVYNDVCGNYQYYWYRYSGMLVGTNKNMTTDKAGYTVPETHKFHAENCTVHFGNWNDYYYCEFEKNGHPSYSGPNDYKFSRVPIEDLTWNDENENQLIDENERDSVACKHEHTTAEDNCAIYLPFNQLFTGYGWGVKHIPLGEFDGVTILDRETADSKVKFEKADAAKDSYTTESTVAIGELFEAATLSDEKLSIDTDKVQVTVSPVGETSTAGATYTPNTTDWTQGTLTFSGIGEAAITITDYYFCTPTTINVTITERTAAVKFETKFNGDFLYRVGNQNTVSVGSLFAAKDGATINNAGVAVTIVKLDENMQVSGTYTANTTDWTKGSIQFSGTGVVKVTITDNNYCTPTELTLEVVDAVNATTAASATNNNVVLLSDISSGFTVSGRYTVYGNGFTLNYTGNGQYLNNGLKQGIITVTENGTLDNLRIKASIYPTSYLYYEEVKKGPKSVEGDKTRYHYQLSAVAVSGNATISNCYIYGSRNNIFVGAGDVTITDTILECGTLSNIEIQSSDAYTVTLNNVTTIQHQMNPTLGDTASVMMGAGVIVVPENDEAPTNPKIIINGHFRQYNWVTEADYSAVTDSNAKMIINAALNATAFNHTVNGKKASNLGIIYLNTADYAVTNNVNLPYARGHITLMPGTEGEVYSLQNAKENQIFSNIASVDKTTVNGLYQPQFKFNSDLGGQLIPDDGSDEFCYRDGDTVKVMFPSGDTKVLDLAGLVNIAKYTGQDLSLEITCKDSDDKAVDIENGKVALSAAGVYTVTYSVTDTLFYNADGNKIEKSLPYSWDIIVDVSLKDVAIPNAYFEFDSSKQVIYRSGNSNIVQFIPFLAGLKIYDYNGQTSYLRFDGDNDFNKIAKASINNVNTTGEAQGYHIVTIELVDGGRLIIDMDVRANSGSSTHSGSIKVRNNVIYVVNGGTTSGKGQTWKIYSYKFVGNNGTEINSGAITFGTAGVDCSTATKPSSNFDTTIKYTVTYDANSGNCGQSLGYATSVATAVTLPTPTKSGNIFAGWYTAASGGTRVGGAGESYTPSANITLYAQWGKPCTVTYNANGGSCGTPSEKYSGTALTLPTPSRDGYWFTGWYDAANGGNKIGEAGEAYNPEGEITLYAHWQEAIEYTVTYVANGGTCDTESATYAGTALTLPTPNRTGYTFNGWYTAASGGTKVDNPDAYIPSANITLYAQWKINSYTITVTTQNATVKVNGTVVSNNGTVSIQYGNEVTVEVTYSESDKQSTTITGADGTTYTSPFDMPAQNVTINATSSSCVTPDTLITLADGTKKRVDSLTGEELLLVWNLETGRYDAAPIVFVDTEKETEYEIIHLYFSDGSDVKVISEHGFFDLDLGKYVYIDANNYANYVGHRFVAEGDIAKDNWNVVTLDEVVIETEVTTAWSPVTFEHLCYYTNGVLSMPGGIDGLFNIFDVDTKTMSYDVAQMQKDIETYGLFTYEDFDGMIPEIAFEAFNGAYLKVSIGKGLLTWEDIAYLAERYMPLM